MTYVASPSPTNDPDFYLSYESNEELIARRERTEKSLEALRLGPVYPPPGYVYPHARIHFLEERINKINTILMLRSHSDL